MIGLIILALYQVLKHSSMPLMSIAPTLAMLGIAAYFASTIAFEMLSLSNKYAAATTEADKSTLIDAGQVLITTWQGTAFDIGYVMEGIAFLMIGFVMLQSGIFSNTAAYFGIILGILSLVPPTVPVIGMFFAIGSLIPLVVWLTLIARKLFQLPG